MGRTAERYGPAWFGSCREVEDAVARHNLATSQFGIHAAEDSNLILRLRAGRKTLPDTIERVAPHIDKLDVARVVPRFGSRKEGVDHLVELLIEARDGIDGDTDAESGNDENSFDQQEGDGPGYAIADPSGPTWTEWQSRGRHKLQDKGAEQHECRNGIPDQFEDDGDSDSHSEVENGPFDPEEDRCLAGDCGAVITNGNTFGARATKDKAELGRCMEYGVDQSSASSADKLPVEL